MGPLDVEEELAEMVLVVYRVVVEEEVVKDEVVEGGGGVGVEDWVEVLERV